ncbi:hypothetical protein F0562_007192 [Nyssa sinensis]|uniref:Uncharacterized protein n=1 Tax=Nyssa sinensis TaxID=561372 RepID=A0A5J5A4J7_9ASTE|nr:hypothetical protein F0562_007192 [Nyssa sinensis]
MGIEHRDFPYSFTTFMAGSGPVEEVDHPTVRGAPKVFKDDNSLRILDQKEKEKRHRAGYDILDFLGLALESPFFDEKEKSSNGEETKDDVFDVQSKGKTLVSAIPLQSSKGIKMPSMEAIVGGSQEAHVDNGFAHPDVVQETGKFCMLLQSVYLSLRLSMIDVAFPRPNFQLSPEKATIDSSLSISSDKGPCLDDVEAIIGGLFWVLLKKNKHAARSPLTVDTRPFLVKKAKVSSFSQALATEAPLSRDALSELQAQLAPEEEEREMAKMLVHRRVARERFKAWRTSTHPLPTLTGKLSNLVSSNAEESHPSPVVENDGQTTRQEKVLNKAVNVGDVGDAQEVADTKSVDVP